ncbi:MAG: HD domain-containing protein [Vallitaleaceae bacterium]|jgi:uncharacterized protein|nr:HD domain-containing protein [Vallitaleaceae bacterium]
MNQLIEKTRDYAIQQIRLNGRPKRYHFRDRVSHTKRVLNWAKRISEIEGGDIEIIEMAVWLHDIGWDHIVNHALVSGKMSKVFLESIDYPQQKKMKVLQAITYHNSRSKDLDFNIETEIVRDADMLDEVGATTILWDALGTSYNDQASYEMVYEKSVNFYNHLKNNQKYLLTQTGRALFDERLAVYKQVILELAYELNL